MPADEDSFLATVIEEAYDVEAPLATVYRGLRYEADVMDTLGKHGFQLSHTGRVGDKGIDLRGYWSLPDPHGLRVNVIVQCKNSTKRLGSKYLRDLEGALTREPPNTVAFLVSPKGCTDVAQGDANSSRYPLVFIAMSEGHKISSFWHN